MRLFHFFGSTHLCPKFCGLYNADIHALMAACVSLPQDELLPPPVPPETIPHREIQNLADILKSGKEAQDVHFMAQRSYWDKKLKALETPKEMVVSGPPVHGVAPAAEGPVSPPISPKDLLDTVVAMDKMLMEREEVRRKELLEVEKSAETRVEDRERELRREREVEIQRWKKEEDEEKRARRQENETRRQEDEARRAEFEVNLAEKLAEIASHSSPAPSRSKSRHGHHGHHGSGSDSDYPGRGEVPGPSAGDVVEDAEGRKRVSGEPEPDRTRVAETCALIEKFHLPGCDLDTCESVGGFIKLLRDARVIGVRKPIGHQLDQLAMVESGLGWDGAQGRTVLRTSSAVL